MFHFKPIFRTLMRRKLTASLMIIQIAIVAAIFSNLSFIIQEMHRVLNIPTGFKEELMFTVTLRPLVEVNYATAQRDISALEQLNGVNHAAIVRWMPLGGNAINTNLRIDAAKDSTSVAAPKSNISPKGLDALGLTLIAGRNFTQNDMSIEKGNKGAGPRAIIISQALAEALFGKNTNAVGKTIFEDNNAREIIGISENSLGFTRPFGKTAENTAFYPAYDDSETELRYLIRVNNAQERANIIEAATATLTQNYHNQLVLYVDKVDDLKELPNFVTKITVTLFAVFMIVLGFVIAFAIGGQTLFNVNQRIKQIGIYRALGASRSNVIQQLLIENAIICGVGLAIGTALSLLVNQVAITATQSPPMSPWFVIITGISILTICLGSAAIPAWQAGKISPSIATRTL